MRKHGQRVSNGEERKRSRPAQVAYKRTSEQIALQVTAFVFEMAGEIKTKLVKMDRLEMLTPYVRGRASHHRIRLGGKGRRVDTK